MSDESELQCQSCWFFDEFHECELDTGAVIELFDSNTVRCKRNLSVMGDEFYNGQ